MAFNPETDLIGRNVDIYKIKKLVGKGAHSYVFIGETPYKNFALKVLSGQWDTAFDEEKVTNEVLKASKVLHRSVIELLPPVSATFEDLGVTVLCIPMHLSKQGSCAGRPPFIDGVDNRSIISIIDLADGLRALHKGSVLHCDIKPGNILKFEDRSGGEDVPVYKFADFDTARIGYSGNKDEKAYPWSTPEYSSLERLETKVVNEKSDIYSLGATLYYMLTGVKPYYFKDREDRESIIKILKENKRPKKTPNEINQNCNPYISLLVMRMMDINAEARPSIDECIQELKKIQRYLTPAGSYNIDDIHACKPLAISQAPIWCAPRVKKVFHPRIYQNLGLDYFVCKITTKHLKMNQLTRIVKNCSKSFKDCFTVHEVWGTENMHLGVWCRKEIFLNWTKLFRAEHPATELV